MLFVGRSSNLFGRIYRPNSHSFFVIIIINVLVVLAYHVLSTCQSSICWSMRPSPGYVVTIPSNDRRAKNVIRLFKKYAHLDLHLFYGVNGNLLYQSSAGRNLLPGELGLRDSMKNLFTMAVEKNFNEMFVFEDDALPHLNFTRLFQQLPSRCREADVLLLGAMVTFTKRDRRQFDVCFDADKKTYGSHALYIKKSAFGPILDWLIETDVGPFDTVYEHLQNQGIIVRVAYPPFLSIPDLSHASSVNVYRGIDRLDPERRAKMHRWKLNDYPVPEIAT